MSVFIDDELKEDFKKAFGTKRTLRVDEVADYLRVSTKTVRRMCREGRLSHIRTCEGGSGKLVILRLSFYRWCQKRNGFN